MAAEIRINVGCGKKILDGWINVDVAAHPKAPRGPDVIADARNIPLADECADELMAIHLIEHFYLWEVPEVLREWRRLLKPGGRLVLECPNIRKCAQNLLNGGPEQFSMWGFYGNPEELNPYMCHRWGWTPETLQATLEAHGFGKVREERPEWHGAGKDHRDMRLVAVRI